MLKDIEAKVKIPLTFMIVAMMIIISVIIFVPSTVAENVHSDNFDDNDLNSNPDWNLDGSPQSSNTQYYGDSGYSLHITASDSGTEYVYDTVSIPDTGLSFYFRVYVDSVDGADHTMLARIAHTNGDDSFIPIIGDSPNQYWGMRIRDEGASGVEYFSSTSVTLDQWYNVTVRADGSYVGLWVEDVEVVNQSYDSGQTFNEVVLGDTSGSYVCDAYFDDYQLWNTTEDAPRPPTEPSEGESVFEHSGTDGNDRICWSGQNGTTVWSNATSYGTLNVTTKINLSDNCTEIRLFLDDPDASIGAGNITVYGSSDQSNWGVPTHNPSGNGNGVFENGGVNITFNATTWNAGTMGTNPFPIDNGAGWQNTSLYFRFTLAIPVTASAGTYTEDDWDIWWYVEYT